MTEVTSWSDCMVHDHPHTFVVASVAFVEHWTSDLVETELIVHVSDFLVGFCCMPARSEV